MQLPTTMPRSLLLQSIAKTMDRRLLRKPGGTTFMKTAERIVDKHVGPLLNDVTERAHRLQEKINENEATALQIGFPTVEDALRALAGCNLDEMDSPLKRNRRNNEHREEPSDVLKARESTDETITELAALRVLRFEGKRLELLSRLLRDLAEHSEASPGPLNSRDVFTLMEASVALSHISGVAKGLDL